MSEPLKLMCILAHPDDESLGTGGTLAKYGAEDGVQTFLITATRGERGWLGDPAENPGLDALGKIREAELRNAVAVLGVERLVFLDYIDGDLDQADSDEGISKIVEEIRRIQPHVVLTFAPDGGYGHPDHIAICQFATAATVAAADPNFAPEQNLAAHRVSKLYYLVFTADEMVAYENAFGELVMNIDGVERRSVPWEPWEVTTWIDTESHWPTVWEAISCHRSQLPTYSLLENLPEEHHKNLWGRQKFYRAFSLVNGGRDLEDDLFAGLR